MSGGIPGRAMTREAAEGSKQQKKEWIRDKTS